MSNRFVFIGFIIIAVAIVAGLWLAPGEADSEDFYTDASHHIDNMENITLDYYKGWMDALDYYQHFNQNTTEPVEQE